MNDNHTEKQENEHIENVRAEFEKILQFVTSEEAKTATADHIERSLFQFLLCIGSQLLLLFFQVRSQACEKEQIIREGQTIQYHNEQKRVYLSIFGQVDLWRPYFYAKGGGYTPLDDELSLGKDRYSDLVREILNCLAVDIPYNKSVSIFKRIFQTNISTRVQQKIVADDAKDVLAYYEQKPPPSIETEAEILVVQTDGKGVPIIKEDASPSPIRLGKGQKHGRKKEAVVTSVYTIARNTRTAQEVIESFFQENNVVKKEHTPLSRPQNKHIWATLDGKDIALARLQQQTSLRQGAHIQDKVALADGCEALQERIEKQFPDFTLILDFIHANEYLWKVANSLFKEGDEQRTKWVKKQTKLMLTGQTQAIIDNFRSRAKKKSRTIKQVEKLQKTANYFERNLPYMAYDLYLANGWPIASGVIEGACRHFVKDRLELSGMRWLQTGAESLLRLRAIAENGDWDEYYLFHRQQRHLRLYETPFPAHNSFESLALELPLTDRLSQPVVDTPHSDYSALPLAS